MADWRECHFEVWPPFYSLLWVAFALKLHRRLQSIKCQVITLSHLSLWYIKLSIRMALHVQPPSKTGNRSNNYRLILLYQYSWRSEYIHNVLTERLRMLLSRGQENSYIYTAANTTVCMQSRKCSAPWVLYNFQVYSWHYQMDAPESSQSNVRTTMIQLVHKAWTRRHMSKQNLWESVFKATSM